MVPGFLPFYFRLYWILLLQVHSHSGHKHWLLVLTTWWRLRYLKNRGVKHPKPITHVERTLLVLTGKVHFSNPSPLNIHDLMYLSYRHTDLSFVATVQPGSVDARDGAESMSRRRCRWDWQILGRAGSIQCCLPSLLGGGWETHARW